jgi:hypothetical protein
MPHAGDASYPGGHYRTLDADAGGAIHPGCSVAGLEYAPAAVAGYPCAAVEYAFPAGWQSFVHPDPSSLSFPADTTARDQLAEVLPAHGFRTYAVDLRTDLVDDPASPEGKDTGNTPRNSDHGWTVPIVQGFVKQVAIAYPERHIALVGFSLGATTVRDALRRLRVEHADGTCGTSTSSRASTRSSWRRARTTASSASPPSAART